MKVYELLKQTKKNAPKFFATYAKKRIAHIELELQELRNQYKNTSDPVKKNIIKEMGTEIKEELNYLKQQLSLDKD